MGIRFDYHGEASKICSRFCMEPPSGGVYVAIAIAKKSVQQCQCHTNRSGRMMSESCQSVRSFSFGPFVYFGIQGHETRYYAFLEGSFVHHPKPNNPRWAQVLVVYRYYYFEPGTEPRTFVMKVGADAHSRNMTRKRIRPDSIMPFSLNFYC